MPRKQPKFLFELSAREARELLNSIPGDYEALMRTRGRLRQFLHDAEEIPLTEEETDEISQWWKDTDEKDPTLVFWGLPPGQQRREYKDYLTEERAPRPEKRPGRG